MTAITVTKLTASQARALHRAEVDVARLKVALETAEKRRDDLRGTYRELVPLSEDLEERAKGVRTAAVGGVIVRITPIEGQENFSIERFLANGGSKAVLEPGMKLGRGYDRWTVKDARGPSHIDRVEPQTS